MWEGNRPLLPNKNSFSYSSLEKERNLLQDFEKTGGFYNHGVSLLMGNLPPHGVSLREGYREGSLRTKSLSCGGNANLYSLERDSSLKGKGGSIPSKGFLSFLKRKRKSERDTKGGQGFSDSYTSAPPLKGQTKEEREGFKAFEYFSKYVEGKHIVSLHLKNQRCRPTYKALQTNCQILYKEGWLYLPTSKELKDHQSFLPAASSLVDNLCFDQVPVFLEYVINKKKDLKRYAKVFKNFYNTIRVKKVYKKGFHSLLSYSLPLKKKSRGYKNYPVSFQGVERPSPVSFQILYPFERLAHGSYKTTPFKGFLPKNKKTKKRGTKGTREFSFMDTRDTQYLTLKLGFCSAKISREGYEACRPGFPSRAEQILQLWIKNELCIPSTKPLPSNREGVEGFADNDKGELSPEKITRAEGRDTSSAKGESREISRAFSKRPKRKVVQGISSPNKGIKGDKREPARELAQEESLLSFKNKSTFKGQGLQEKEDSIPYRIPSERGDYKGLLENHSDLNLLNLQNFLFLLFAIYSKREKPRKNNYSL